jgi:hypothetical protein
MIATALAASGLVWIGQGLGILRGSSFMVGDPRWAIAGGLLVAGAALLGWSAIRGRSRA